MRNSFSGVMVSLAAALCLAAPASAAQGVPVRGVPVGGGAARPAAFIRDVPKSLTLEQAVAFGLAHNPTMLSARALLQGSEFSRKSARADFFPTVTETYGVTRYDRQPRSYGVASGDQAVWSSDLNVHQPVFTGFKLLSTYEKAKLTKEQNAAKLNQTELTLVGSIQTQYLAHLKAKMDVKSAEDSVARLTSQLKVTQEFFKVGLKSKLDVLQAEVDLDTAKQSVLSAKDSLDTTRAKLNSLLNIPIQAPVNYIGSLAYSPFTLSLTECLNRAYKLRPDIAIGEKSVAIAEKDKDISASAFYPQVGLDYDYNRKGDSPAVDHSKYLSNENKDYWDVGASVSWELFQWGSTYYDYRSSAANVTKLRADLDSTKLNAGYEVKEYILAQKTAADSIDVARMAVTTAHESYRVALARYKAQVGTNTDLLTAQASIGSAEAQLSQALSNYETALSNLYVAMGEKNAALEIR